MSTDTAVLPLPADPVSNVLKWILLAVAVACFSVMGWATVVTYRTTPPQPARFVSTGGVLIMSGADILAGKGGFQKADLMDYGSLYGMGSYYGQDYTASTLVNLAEGTRNAVALARYRKPYPALAPDDAAAASAEMRRDLKGIDLTAETVVLPDAVIAAVIGVRAAAAAALNRTDRESGWTAANSLRGPLAVKTADFLIFSAFTTVARRPGSDVSWTQNWPYEPIVGNAPTPSTFIWTWASFCFTFLCFGLVLFVYELFLNHPDDAPMDPVLADFLPLTPSQRKVGKYFLVVAILLLVQIGAGTIMAHSYYDRTSFYGLDINAIFPFSFLRDVHIQAPIIWICLAWIGAALFLAPAMAGGHEAKGQGLFVDLLFWVTLIIVAGALIGDYLGIMGVVGAAWFWFGNQGLSYLELGRFWQILFSVGLGFWCLIVFRALWPSRAMMWQATRQFWSGRIRLENLIWASTINIAVLYVFGMIPLTGIEKSFAITDYWRWWVVHLWVEQSFEFFAAAMTAYLLMAVGLVSRKLAERTVFFELILIFLGGVLGTGHHLYWVGATSLWVPLGSMFSFIEVLPLVLLVLDAIQHYRLIKAHREFKYGLAYTYVIGAAFWNFVGAGVFGGGTLNAPLVNYYEHGTFLTLNHAHTALFGAFGELAIGLVYFCIRYITAGHVRFKAGLGLTAFWLYNAGLVLWVTLNFFPIGWPQLMAVYEHGYAYARSDAFYRTTLVWQWLRMPGDIVFAAGALLMAADFAIKLGPLYPPLARLFGLGPSARDIDRPSHRGLGAGTTN
ncbi:MAG TPA: cbb3-type cytochrome c oxidase subunit I [Caulobacteraceae bacterium]|nr:cbb3-type cytochrome c oxidase subunit I [Caulobacteraceae bacterium]